MKSSKLNAAVSASALALAVMAAPLQAQDAQTADTANSAASEDGISAGEAALTIGAMAGGLVAMDRAAQIGLNAKPKAQKAGVSSLAELKRRGEIARAARIDAAPRPTSLNGLKNASGAARPANLAQSDLGKVLAKGDAARDARSAANAGRSASTAASAARPANIVRSDLGQVLAKGDAAKAARAGRIAGSSGDLAELGRRGDAARTVRSGMRMDAAATKNTPKFGQRLLNPAGPNADVAKLVAKGDAAQLARGGRLINEGQVVRNIADKGGDISKLNKAGRAAQVARGAGGLKAASTSAKAAEMAKTAKTAATAGKLGKGGRAALAGTGVGAAIVVAEIAGTEGVKALTGAELQDPISTGFQYGAAIFDKDVTLADVAAQRLDHHRENFRKLGETLTTKGKLKENLKEYGQEKKEDFQKFAAKVDKNDRAARAGIRDATGIELERRSDVNKRYAEALAGDNKVKAVAGVAGQRTKHHVNNAKRATKKLGCGIGNMFKKKSKEKQCK